MALINIQKVLLTAFTCTIFTLYYDVGNTHGLVQNVIPNNNSNSKTNEINEYAQHLKTKIARSEAKSERRRKERESHVSREKCSSCQRPPILCVCEALPSKRIVTSTKILVLQHPNEFKRKSLSTVPLMPLVKPTTLLLITTKLMTKKTYDYTYTDHWSWTCITRV